MLLILKNFLTIFFDHESFIKQHRQNSQQLAICKHQHTQNVEFHSPGKTKGKKTKKEIEFIFVLKEIGKTLLLLEFSSLIFAHFYFIQLPDISLWFRRSIYPNSKASQTFKEQNIIALEAPSPISTLPIYVSELRICCSVSQFQRNTRSSTKESKMPLVLSSSGAVCALATLLV